MSTSFNFIKYFLTGSSKPSPIYISSYSSPAREQNRRLQVNLQCHFYRRSISRDQHRKGSGSVDLPELGQHSRGQGALPGDLWCSSESPLWFKQITSTVAPGAWISKSVLPRPPCHWWGPAEKSLTPILCPVISFSHSFFLLTCKISSILCGERLVSILHCLISLFSFLYTSFLISVTPSISKPWFENAWVHGQVSISLRSQSGLGPTGVDPTLHQSGY